MKTYINKILALILTILVINNTNAQVNIKANIKDKETQFAIPYASASIIGTSLGTLTNQLGELELQVASISVNDTLKISAIGYEDKKVIIKDITSYNIYLTPIVYDLTEVKIKPKKVLYKHLGILDYDKTTCTSFMELGDNWMGKQAAILIENKQGITFYIESFGFYIIKNEYTDSLTFRLMLYELDENNMPGKTFLKQPIIFKTNAKNGEVRIDLKDKSISSSQHFFISLECLEKEMDGKKFCFDGDIKTPSYFKKSLTTKWGKVKGGGGAFNVKVSYRK